MTGVVAGPALTAATSVAKSGADRVPLATKLYYGAGAIAYGIKDNGFATFLLIFYNQVVGLPSVTVGLVIAVALIFDAMIDPLLGVLSDRTRTRWGRRHPWLYASALPITFSWMLLWHPPEGTQNQMLGWLFATAIFTRAAIATNEVPSLALAPELTRDYHERTAVLRYRYLFGWIGGLSFLMLAYGWFLNPARGGSQTGPMALAGYGNWGVASAVTMGLSVLVSAIGTHRFVVSRATRAVEVQSFGDTIAAIRQTLANRAFLVLMIGGVLMYTAQGVNFALSNYLLGFVWQLRPAQFIIYSIALFAGVVLAFLFVTPIGRVLGKPRAAASLLVVAATLLVAPYLLHVAGLFPEPGSPALLPVFLSFCVVTTALGVAAFITGSSMMSDVVEAAEEHTGRREEGLFFAGALFMQKCSGGIGILVTSLIIAAAQFPAKAVVGQVPGGVLDRLILIFCAVYWSLSVLAAIVTLRFPFGRVEHEARLAKLAVAEAGAG